MKRTLAKAIMVIAEAGLEVLAERIKKRRSKNGNHDRLDYLRDGFGAYDLRDRSADHPHFLGAQWAMTRKRKRRRSISWER